MIGNLPLWVIDMLVEIEESEDEHPTYYGDFSGGLEKLDGCPESRFLSHVPPEVRRDIAAVRHVRDLAPIGTDQ